MTCKLILCFPNVILTSWHCSRPLYLADHMNDPLQRFICHALLALNGTIGIQLCATVSILSRCNSQTIESAELELEVLSHRNGPPTYYVHPPSPGRMHRRNRVWGLTRIRRNFKLTADAGKRLVLIRNMMEGRIYIWQHNYPGYRTVITSPQISTFVVENALYTFRPSEGWIYLKEGGRGS